MSVRRDRSSGRLDRLRWWLLKRMVRKMNAIELLGYIAAEAGYTDYPILDEKEFRVQATGSGATL